MNKEEYDKLSTFDKIDYDIAMEIYNEHNSKIASINDHLGDIFDYRDLQDAKECELQDEMRMYQDALKEKCDAIDKAIRKIDDLQQDLFGFEKTIWIYNDLKEVKKSLIGE